jgi:hypothetical protein
VVGQFHSSFSKSSGHTLTTAVVLKFGVASVTGLERGDERRSDRADAGDVVVAGCGPVVLAEGDQVVVGGLEVVRYRAEQDRGVVEVDRQDVLDGGCADPMSQWLPASAAMSGTTRAAGRVPPAVASAAGTTPRW